MFASNLTTFRFIETHSGYELAQLEEYCDNEKLLRYLEFPFDNNGENIILWMENVGLLRYLVTRRNFTTYIAEKEDTYDYGDQLKNNFCNRLLKIIIPYIRKDSRYASTCPEEGEFYGYKFVGIDKDIAHKQLFDIGIAKLKIPGDSKRVCSILDFNKCRCAYAIVEEIRRVKVIRPIYTSGREDLIMQECDTGDDTADTVEKAYSFFYPNYDYNVGRLQIADNYNGDPWESCSNGIHFFATKQEALRFAKLNLLH